MLPLKNNFGFDVMILADFSSMGLIGQKQPLYIGLLICKSLHITDFDQDLILIDKWRPNNQRDHGVNMSQKQ